MYKGSFYAVYIIFLIKIQIEKTRLYLLKKLQINMQFTN